MAAGPDVFKFKLLNNSLFKERVQDFDLGKKQLKQSSKAALGNLTWGELHDTAVIRFKPGCPGRPYRRSLALMARMLLLHASHERWEFPAGVNPSSSEFSYMSDDARIECTAEWVHSVSALYANQ